MTTDAHPLHKSAHVCKYRRMPAPDDLIGTAEAADLLGKPITTINRMALDGRLPVAVQMPGRTGARLYRRADVLAFITPGRIDAA